MFASFSELLAPTLCQVIALAIVMEDLVRIKQLQDKKIQEVDIYGVLVYVINHINL